MRQLVSTLAAPPKDALGPDAGKLKVTSAFGTRLLPTSRTVAWSGFWKEEPTTVDWFDPPVAVMLAGPPELLVRSRLLILRRSS